MEVLDVLPIVASTVASEPKVSFLVLHFHLYFTVFSVLVTIFLLRAWLYLTISRAFATFKSQSVLPRMRNRCRTIFSSRYLFLRSEMFSRYHQIVDEDEIITEHHDGNEEIEMIDHHATISTGSSALEELSNDMVGQSPIDILISGQDQTISTHIVSAFETYPQGISRTVLAETIPFDCFDSQTAISPKLFPQSGPEHVSVNSSDLGRDDNPRDLEQNAITDHDRGLFINVQDHNGMVSVIENMLSPLVDALVRWIVQATDKME